MSASAAVNGKVVNKAGNIVSQAEAKVLANPAGARLYGQGASEAFLANYDIYANRNVNLDSAKTLLKNLSLNEANGVTQATLPRTKAKGIAAQIDMKAPTGYLNGYTTAATNGLYGSVGDLLQAIG